MLLFVVDLFLFLGPILLYSKEELELAVSLAIHVEESRVALVFASAQQS